MPTSRLRFHSTSVQDRAAGSAIIAWAAAIARASTLPPPTVPNRSPEASTSIFVPASCGALPTASASVTSTKGSPVAAISASRSISPCGTGIGGSAW